MRVLSNHATIGRDAGSAEIKKYNKTVSQGAQKLLHSVDLTTFCKQTINEHPKPILATWEWLRENAEHLSVEEVWNEFVANKMVTITKKKTLGSEQVDKTPLGTCKLDTIFGYPTGDLIQNAISVSQRLESKGPII